jgi:hypothetical protein
MTLFSARRVRSPSLVTRRYRARSPMPSATNTAAGTLVATRPPSHDRRNNEPGVNEGPATARVGSKIGSAQPSSNSDSHPVGPAFS